MQKRLNSKNFSRVGQLRIFSEYVKLNYKKQVKNNKYLKRDYVLAELQYNIRENNKSVKAPLKKFIRQLIVKKNKYEIDELWTKVIKYAELLESSIFWQMNWKDYSDELLHLVSYPDQYSLEEVLFELLYNFVFLPYYDTQENFNKQMGEILSRLDNFLIKFFSNYSLIIKKIDAKSVFNIISYTKGKKEIFVKNYIEGNKFIDKLDLSIYLPGFALDNIDDGNNSILLTYTLSYYPQELYLRDIVLFLLEARYGVLGAGKFEIADYPELVVEVDVSLPGLNEGIESARGKEYFTISFITKPKKLGKENVFYQYISDSLLYLEAEAMNFYNTLTNIDKLALNYIKDKLEANQDLKAILDEISIFFSEDEFKNLENIVKKNDPEEFLKESRKIIFKKFKLPRKSKLPVVVDFNSAIVDYLDEINKEDENTITNKNHNNFQLGILEQVRVVESVGKLFLEKDTERKVKIIENYLKNMDKFQQYLLKTPKGAILYGPPGVGKTETVKYLAKQTGIDVYKVDISSILNMYVGESEKRIKQMFTEFYRILERKKAILFIDEADGFFGKRDSSNKDLQNGVRSIALQELEGFANNPNFKNGFIFLGTNFLDLIDKALRERFSFFLKYELPSLEKRKEYIKFMINYISKEKNAKFENINIEELARLTDNWSYRALYNLFNNALQQVVILKGTIPPLITQQDIIDSLSATKEDEDIAAKKVGFLKN